MTCESEHLRVRVLSAPKSEHLRVHKVLRLPRNLHFEVHQVLCLPRNLHFEVHKVLCLPRNLHFEFTKRCACRSRSAALRGVPATKSAHRGSQSAVPATKSANEPHVQKSRFTAPVTKSELLWKRRSPPCHESAAPATKSAFQSAPTAPIPCTCHEKSTLEHQNTRFPLRLPRKVTTMCENAHGTTTRAQSLQAPAAGPGRFCEPAQSKCTLTMSRGMNVL